MFGRELRLLFTETLLFPACQTAYEFVSLSRGLEGCQGTLESQSGSRPEVAASITGYLSEC